MSLTGSKLEALIWSLPGYIIKLRLASLESSISCLHEAIDFNCH